MKSFASLGCLLVLLSPLQLLGLGIRLADQDPQATARGNAFAATADNPSALYYNPAGITQLEGHHISLGLYGITYEARYTSAATGARSFTKDKPQLLPQLYYVFSPKEKPLKKLFTMLKKQLLSIFALLKNREIQFPRATTPFTQ